MMDGNDFGTSIQIETVLCSVRRLEGGLVKISYGAVLGTLTGRI